MKADVLKKYAKAIEENDKLEYNKEKEIDISKSHVKFEDSSFYINFRDSWNNDLRSKFPGLSFTTEEKLEISNIVFKFIENKYKSNLLEAKKEFQGMLIAKL